MQRQEQELHSLRREVEEQARSLRGAVSGPEVGELRRQLTEAQRSLRDKDEVRRGDAAPFGPSARRADTLVIARGRLPGAGVAARNRARAVLRAHAAAGGAGRGAQGGWRAGRRFPGGRVSDEAAVRRRRAGAATRRARFRRRSGPAAQGRRAPAQRSARAQRWGPGRTVWCFGVRWRRRGRVGGEAAHERAWPRRGRRWRGGGCAETMRVCRSSLARCCRSVLLRRAPNSRHRPRRHPPAFCMQENRTNRLSSRSGDVS